MAILRDGSITYMKDIKNIIRYKSFWLILGIFVLHIFFRFYNIEKWATFGWDQVDNAWAAARILLAHKYPLLGMVAKGNSGIYIGPIYYYLVSVFYFFTRLNPIASPILAGCTAAVSFWIIYRVAKHIFNQKVAIVACLIYTFSSFIMNAERIQWPVNFIAPLSLLIFYYLVKVLEGEAKYFLHVAIIVGLSFHIHFTSIYYPIIILLSLPFVPMKKDTLKYIALALPLFIVFFIPQIIYYIQSKNTHGLTNYTGYAQTYYHGLHLRRVLQIAHDAFIKFQSILELSYPFLRNAVFLYIPVFFFAYLKMQPKKAWFKLFYIVTLWIIVPWIIFSTYSGEISDYYFSAQLYLAVIIFAYITVWIWESKKLILRMGISAFWLYYAFTNTQAFFHTQNGNLQKDFMMAQEAANGGHILQFTEGDPQSYLYFYFLYTQKKPLPYKL